MSPRQIAEATMAAYPNHSFFNSDSEDPANHNEFSHQKCELCDGLPGERFTVHALIIPADGDECKIDFEACPDCVYYVAYGEGPPEYFKGEDV